MTLFKWSTTAATNDDVDSSVNWQEGQSPGSVNNSARAMMAAIAKFRDDMSGNLVTAGTSTAYTLTTNQTFTALTDGIAVVARMDETSGATPTLNVDSLGAKSIAGVYGTAIGTGGLRAGAVYMFVYDSTDDKWIAHGGGFTALGMGTDGYVPVAKSSTATGMAWSALVPAGTVALFVQTAAPTGWTKGATHDDKALRVVTGAAGTGGSQAFTTCFATGRTFSGATASYTLLAADMPSHQHFTSTDGVSSSSALTAGNYMADQGSGSSDSNYILRGTGSTADQGLTSATGGGGGHSHDAGTLAVAMDVNYVDVIIATKDAY
jgi:hypothetical protein